MRDYQAFLESQEQMAVATSADGLWIVNLFYGADERGIIYFISPTDAQHSQHILMNPKIAFAVSWFADDNHENRKGIQGTGICRMATSAEDISKGVAMHNARYPEFANRITTDYIHSTENNAAVWIIEPKQIRYWDDELYPENKFRDFDC